MFDKLFGRTKNQSSDTSDDSGDLQLAFAALLVEAARADEKYEDHETAIIDRALKTKFALDDAGAATLRARAETAQDGANDIQRFTRIAKTMSGDEKTALIEELWEIVLSDGDRDPCEDPLIRRICGLIYVDDKESGAARSRVAARLARA